MVQDISVRECLSEGWQYYKRHIWLTVGVFIAFYALIIAFTLIPYIKYPFTYLVMPALGPGLYFYFLNVARDTNPRFSDLFAGFRRYGTFFGLFLVTWVVYMVGLLPTFLLFGVSAVAGLILGTTQPEDFSMGLLACYIVNMLLLSVVLYRFWQIYFVIFDEPQLPLVDALKRSSEITKGNGHNVVLFAVAGVGIFFLLLVALIIPALIVGPMILVAFARMYLKLKAMHDEPTPVPVTPSPMM